MKQATGSVEIQTRGKGLYDFTLQVERWLSQQHLSTGLITLLVQHTSASLTIQENADPDVVADLNDFFGRIAPEDNKLYRHTIEGPDDMPAHIRSALTLSTLGIPVVSGRMALGTWQGIYLFEHRSHPHKRKVALHAIGQ